MTSAALQPRIFSAERFHSVTRPAGPTAKTPSPARARAPSSPPLSTFRCLILRVLVRRGGRRRHRTREGLLLDRIIAEAAAHALWLSAEPGDLLPRPATEEVCERAVVRQRGSPLHRDGEGLGPSSQMLAEKARLCSLRHLEPLGHPLCERVRLLETERAHELALRGDVVLGVRVRG